jgi:hypothetical protein
MRWLEPLQRQADSLPESEEDLIADMLRGPESAAFLPGEYGLDR